MATALSHIQFLGLVDSAGGLEEQGFQWSSPQTINPVGLETEESKLRAAHSIASAPLSFAMESWLRDLNGKTGWGRRLAS